MKIVNFAGGKSFYSSRSHAINKRTIRGEPTTSLMIQFLIRCQRNHVITSHFLPLLNNRNGVKIVEIFKDRVGMTCRPWTYRMVIEIAARKMCKRVLFGDLLIGFRRLKIACQPCAYPAIFLQMEIPL